MEASPPTAPGQFQEEKELDEILDSLTGLTDINEFSDQLTDELAQLELVR
jgi:hypothetical protein